MKPEYEFQLMTGETVNELAKAIKELRDATKEFSEEAGKTTTTILKCKKSDIEKDIKHYTQKVKISCFITRWWYKRKLQKAKDGLDAINLIIKEHDANRRSNQSPA